MPDCPHCHRPLGILLFQGKNVKVTYENGKLQLGYICVATKGCYKCPICFEVLFYKDKKAADFLSGKPVPEKKPRERLKSKW